MAENGTVSQSRFRIAFSGDFLDDRGKLIFPDFDLAPVQRHDIEVVFLPYRDTIAASDVADADVLVLLLSRFDSTSIATDGRLALVARFGAGLDTVDIPACSQNGIAVTSTPEGVRRPMAVAIITLMLALTSNLIQKNAIGHSPSKWAQRTHHNGFGLCGRVLGSVGFGSIAREMFALARPYDMRFIAANRSGQHPDAQALGVSLVDLDTVFRNADVIAINCPLTDHTRNLVDNSRLSMMKQTAYLINISRGTIVDQAALANALKERRIAGAALDVLANEPPDPQDSILNLPNVIITPHSLGWTDQLFAKCGAINLAAAIAVLAGEVPTGLVDPKVVQHPAFQGNLKRLANAWQQQ